MPVNHRSFRQILADAVADFAAHGYDNEIRLQDWMRALRVAAVREMVPEQTAEAQIRDALRGIYQRLVENGGLMRANQDAGRFTLERVKPTLRAELDRRILASAALIKLDRDRAVQDTLQRFSGWATSIPMGGSKTVGRRDVKRSIGKSLYAMPYVARRLHIDQGHKFAASLSSIFAADGGAIAGEWHQHYTRYPRVEHTKRDGKIYLVRDSWAHKAGLVKPGPAGYTDDITQPAVEVACRCTYKWLFGVSQLPGEMLTQKGREELARVRAMIAQKQAA